MSGDRILLIIDPQNDFHGGGSLGKCCCSFNYTYTSHPLTEHNYTIPIAVPGADEDAKRIAKLVNDKGDCFDEVIVTLDSHYMIHIAHGHLSTSLLIIILVLFSSPIYYRSSFKN